MDRVDRWRRKTLAPPNPPSTVHNPRSPSVPGSPLLLTFWHWAGVSPYTSPFGLAQTCVFGKQSLGPLCCGWHRCQRPFSRSYGAILPSSLTIVISNAFVSSTRPPVSVCGTVECTLLRGFSRPLLRQVRYVPEHAPGLLPTRTPTPRPTPEKCPHVLNERTRFRNIYLTAIDYALRPRLRTD